MTSSIFAWLSGRILSTDLPTGGPLPNWVAAEIIPIRRLRSGGGGKQTSNWSDFRKPPPSGRFPLRLLIVIGIALAAIGILLWHLSQPVRYSTAIGKTLTVMLPDRSRIVLNTSTAITFKREGNTFRVELESGEILCDLVENPLRQFAVYVNTIRITDKGTSFSVRRTEAGAIVVVRAGSVRISEPQRPDSELTQNQEADVGPDHTVIIKLSPEKVARNLMWQNGRLEFQQVRIADAIKELNRYSKVQIQVVDPDIANFRISGSLSLSDPINAFEELAHGFNWQVENNADEKPVLIVRKVH